MKKVWFFIFCLIFGFLFWCGKRFDFQNFQQYNNTLIAFQEDAVSQLEEYYKKIETISNAEELSGYYLETFLRFGELYHSVEAEKSWDGDASLKTALASYLSWLQLAFEHYEKPIVEKMWAFSGENKNYYRESKALVQESSLLFARELARLDKLLEIEYSAFLQKYNSELSSH